MFTDADCVILGISFDTPEENRAFREDQDFPYLLLSDADRSIGALYEVLRDPDDKFAAFPQRISYLIRPDGVIEKAYDVSDPAGHAAAVLVDLAAAQR